MRMSSPFEVTGSQPDGRGGYVVSIGVNRQWMSGFIAGLTAVADAIRFATVR